ncbi:hypothetical protein U1Q18_032699 [Sarracenia purpurea var. burkii]
MLQASSLLLDACAFSLSKLRTLFGLEEDAFSFMPLFEDLVLGCDLSKKLCCRRCSSFGFQFRVLFLVPRSSGFWVHDVPRSGFDEVWFSIAGLLKKMMGSGCCSSGVANDEVILEEEDKWETRPYGHVDIGQYSLVLLQDPCAMADYVASLFSLCLDRNLCLISLGCRRRDFVPWGDRKLSFSTRPNSCVRFSGCVLMAASSDLLDILKPFYQRASVAEDCLAKLEASLASRF